MAKVNTKGHFGKNNNKSNKTMDLITMDSLQRP